jgi:hypothetical protein
MPAGSVTVTYVLPISGNSKVELHINAPLALDDHDREFILGILEQVGKLAELALPGAKKPEIPEDLALRGPEGLPPSLC